MEKRIYYNYSQILKKLVQYIPSRGLIILNSFLIIPLFTRLLNAKEVSIYLIVLQILNLICTCSFDWIAKAVLRFYAKYEQLDKVELFLSSIFTVSIVVYALTIILYFILKNFLIAGFAINGTVLLLTLLLVVPCGIRQILYQILRLNNNYKLYTFSIILYQLLLVVFFLAFINVLPDASSIITAMLAAVLIMDIYILFSIKFKYKISLQIDKNIILETLKYAIPLVLTNFCYWFVFHSAKFIFQYLNQYVNTSVFGISWALVSSAVTPLAGLFIFVNFPVIVKNFEMNKLAKSYFTNVIQLYLYIMFPFVLLFCFFSEEITGLLLPAEYKTAALILPFFAVTIFLHELMKLINIKYHLQVKTYIETFFSLLFITAAIPAGIFIIEKYSVLGAAFVMLVTELVLITINMFIKIKGSDYINFFKIFKTVVILSLICTLNYFMLHFIPLKTRLTVIVVCVLFLTLNYGLFYMLRKKILL